MGRGRSVDIYGIAGLRLSAVELASLPLEWEDAPVYMLQFGLSIPVSTLIHPVDPFIVRDLSLSSLVPPAFCSPHETLTPYNLNLQSMPLSPN